MSLPIDAEVNDAAIRDDQQPLHSKALIDEGSQRDDIETDATREELTPTSVKRRTVVVSQSGC